MDKEKVAPALGKISSGLYIATAYDEAAPVGMLCSFVEQAGFEPPMLTVAIAPERRVAKAIEAGSKLGIHVLGKSEGGALMKPFINGKDENPFEGLLLKENDYQIPQLFGSLAFLACEMRDKVAGGDHTVYLCEVLDGELANEAAANEPMIRIRTNGFGY